MVHILLLARRVSDNSTRYGMVPVLLYQIISGSNVVLMWNMTVPVTKRRKKQIHCQSAAVIGLLLDCEYYYQYYKSLQQSLLPIQKGEDVVTYCFSTKKEIAQRSSLMILQAS